MECIYAILMSAFAWSIFNSCTIRPSQAGNRMIIKARLQFLLLTVSLAVFAEGAPGQTIQFGQDQLVFPESFKMPSQLDQELLASGWNSAYDTKEFASMLRWRGKSHPFRDDVEFGWAGLGPTRLAIQGQSVYARIAWDNIGFFLKRVETPDHFNIVLHVLHKPWPEQVLTPTQFQAVVRDVELNAKDLPLKILKRQVDAESIAKGCFQQDGCWLWHFILNDEGSVVEYKYAISPKNHVARLARPLIQGPGKPMANAASSGDWGPCSLFLDAATARAKSENKK